MYVDVMHEVALSLKGSGGMTSLVVCAVFPCHKGQTSGGSVHLPAMMQQYIDTHMVICEGCEKSGLMAIQCTSLAGIYFWVQSMNADLLRSCG